MMLRILERHHHHTKNAKNEASVNRNLRGHAPILREPPLPAIPNGLAPVTIIRRIWECGVEHRHLEPRALTLAAIDDVIARGRMRDWLELRDAARADPAVVRRIARVCAAHTADPYAQRHHFWSHYARRHQPAP